MTVLTSQDDAHASTELWVQLLIDLAARNGGVELMPWEVAEQPAAAGPDQRFRVRLLEADPGGELIVQQPTPGAQRRHIKPGAWLGVLMVVNNQRWLGKCPVREVLPGYALNDRARVGAARLGAAVQVRSGQRRNAYRADTLALGLPSVRMWPVPESNDPPNASAAPEQGECVEATLLNISAGGMGMSVDPAKQPAKQLLASRCYRCRLALPVFDEPMLLTVRLVHVKPQRDRTVYLGLKFLFDSAGQRRQFEDRLSRFTVDLEREALRRRNG